MKRIGLIIGQLTWGGAERQLYELAKELPRKGFQPVVYCLSESTDPYKSLLVEAGISVRSFRRHTHFDLKRVWHLRQALKKDQIDLAHAWLEDDDAYCALANLCTNRPWIASMRSRLRNRDWLRLQIDRWVFNHAPAILINEENIQAYLFEYLGIKPREVNIIPNGLDLIRLVPNQTRSEVRRNHQTSDEDHVLLFVGRLDPVKRLDLIVRIHQELLNDINDLRLWIAGSGPEEQNIRKLVAEAGTTDLVTFLGNQSQIQNYYHAADCLLLCSESEGFPNVVLEAMGCALPVVVSPFAGCGKIIIHGETGWISPNLDVKSYTTILNNIFKTPSELRRVAVKGQELVKTEFSVNKMVERMVDLYLRLLDIPNT